MYLIKRRLYWSWVGPYFNRIGVFIERRNHPFATHTERTPGEDKSRKQRHLGDAEKKNAKDCKSPELEETWKKFFFLAFKSDKLADTLSLYF